MAVDGRTVVDVGCGDGGLVRALAARHAVAIGVELAAEPLARARARAPVAGERYVEGVAQALPLDDASADVVVFRHSLHHVPGNALDRALAESARVLRPRGVLYVQEPLAEGPYFELLRLVDDETVPRAAAHAAIRRAGDHGLRQAREVRFDAAVVHASFEAFRDRVLLADAARAADFPAHEIELRERFASLAGVLGARFEFSQPTRVDLLVR